MKPLKKHPTETSMKSHNKEEKKPNKGKKKEEERERKHNRTGSKYI